MGLETMRRARRFKLHVNCDMVDGNIETLTDWRGDMGIELWDIRSAARRIQYVRMQFPRHSVPDITVGYG